VIATFSGVPVDVGNIGFRDLVASVTRRVASLANPQRYETLREELSSKVRDEEHIMAYSDKVVDHYNNPRNVGTLDKSAAEVGTGLVGAPECGDVMRLQIRVNPETNVIEDAKFKTFGCGSAIASSSLATEWVKGKTIDEALSITNTDIVKELALPPVKIHCSVLAEDAIRAAIGDWKKKNNVAETSAVTTAAH
jgi:Fe-S cluster assembly scaffold IscU